MGKTVLVTGCSSGIGRATADAFADHGWRVYATTRDRATLDPFDREEVTPVELDITSQSEVEQVVTHLVEEAGHIDCLVNNAGYGQFGPLEDISTAELREQFEVNVFAPHTLTRAVLPGMRSRGAGTVVNVGSVDDRLPLAGIGAYNGSKYALAGMSGALRQEVAEHGVDVVVVEPGLVATEFYGRALGALPDEDRSPGYEAIYRTLERVGVCRSAPPGVCEPAAVASTIVTAATADAPEPFYQAGPSGRPAVLAAELLPARWLDRIARAGVTAAASGPVQRVLRWAEER